MRTFKPSQKPDPEARTRGTSLPGPAPFKPGGSAGALLQLQRSVGNRAVGRFLQTKLTIGAPGDRYEQEADQLAEQMTRGAETQVQRSSPSIQALGSDAQGAEPAGPALESRLEARRGQGNPLPAPLRGEMESAFNADFGAVRLHADGEAKQMSRDIQAEAFTYGSDIYLGPGGLDPGSRGRRLLAHELTHTIQQGAVPGGTIQRSCHTVVKRDTLFSIARTFGVTVKDICDANGIKETDPLVPGQLLIIPDGKSCAYPVEDQDTLYSISKRFGTTVAAIKAENGLKSNTIKEGQVLSIPVGGSKAAKPAAKPAAKATPKAAPAKAPAKATPAPKPPAPSTTAAKPPAPKPAATPAPAPAALPARAVSSALEAGHEPGDDYASGTLRERTTLREPDKKKSKLSGKKPMFFQAGAAVTLLSSDKDWVEVEGEAFVDPKKPTSAGTQSGWIKRSATTMTLGDYKDLEIEDLTPTYGKMGVGDLDSADVNNVILHQTGGTSGAGTLSTYRDRIAAGSSIGAHYLIDEAGNIQLVIPVNRVASHVGATKPGFATASNSHAVGIEHVGASTRLAVPKSKKDTTTLAANRAALQAMSLSPELKARVLGLSDKDLYLLAIANRSPGSSQWEIYGDINARQKRSSFLLTESLKDDFSLAEADLLPHETVVAKAIGEGENVKEFLVARGGYPRLVSQLESAINGDPKLKADAALVKILDAEKETVAALNKDATESENKDLATEAAAKKPGAASAREALRVSFYDKFWDRHAQLKDLVSFLKTNGSSKPTDLAKKIAAWKS